MFHVFHWFIKAGLNYIKHNRASNREERVADQSSLRYQRKQIMFAPYPLMLFGGFLIWIHVCETLRARAVRRCDSGNTAIRPFMLQLPNLQNNLHVLCGDQTVWCGSWGFREASAALRTDRLSLVREKDRKIGLASLWTDFFGGGGWIVCESKLFHFVSQESWKLLCEFLTKFVICW